MQEEEVNFDGEKQGILSRLMLIRQVECGISSYRLDSYRLEQNRSLTAIPQGIIGEL